MYINATGFHIPSARIANSHFEPLIGLSDEWIVKRTGIHTRSRAGEGEDTNSMALAAIADALPGLPYDIKETDLIIAAHYCAYDTVGTVAHRAQREHGIEGAKALYLSSACSSFANGLEVVEAMFCSGKASKALLVCSEHNSYFADESDPQSGHLWGDGAVAWFLSAEPQADGEPEVLAVYTRGLGHVSKGPEGVYLRTREEGIRMPEGRDVFANACRYMVEGLEKAGEMAGLPGVEAYDRIICHQANGRIVANIAHQLKRPASDFINNIGELGNTGSAGAPLAFAQHRGEMTKGMTVGLTVFGGGYSVGTAVIRI